VNFRTVTAFVGSCNDIEDGTSRVPEKGKESGGVVIHCEKKWHVSRLHKDETNVFVSGLSPPLHRFKVVETSSLPIKL